ncbi:Uncharacterised protein [Burkholderia pseudomallei]|nr:Uncharacterised protein [Burkholderia pseudomallei]
MGRQTAATDAVAVAHSGSGVKPSATNAANGIASEIHASFTTDHVRPDCWIIRSSVCTRGTRISRRSNGFASLSIRSLRIDSRSFCTWPPADIARMRASMRRAAGPWRAFHH